eukprot:250725-Karenia_brevis.AAC.1
MRGKRNDFAAESQQMSKHAREEYIDKVRKLERVKEYLSPEKNEGKASSLNFPNSADADLHDEGYDPS